MKTADLERSKRLKEIKFVVHCHVFAEADSKFSYCGVPRLEQPKHGKGEGNTDYCPACGMIRCPKCKEMSIFN